jgi:hypothetical protein
MEPARAAHLARWADKDREDRDREGTTTPQGFDEQDDTTILELG